MKPAALRPLPGGVPRTALPKPVYAEDGAYLLRYRRFVVARNRVRVLS